MQPSTHPKLYSGLWPSNVGRAAKYAVRHVEGEWKVTVIYESGVGERFLAVDGDQAELVAKVNHIKETCSGSPGGVFYLNEFRHILVPVPHGAEDGTNAHVYCAGRFDSLLSFHFEGVALDTVPIRKDGTHMEPGEEWIGPRPGVAYKLAAGGNDIYFESPGLSEGDQPKVRPGVTRKVQLSRVHGNKNQVAMACAPVKKIRGHQGGRFYVNEHGAMFTPTTKESGEINYIYCGRIDPECWFPEPAI
jgi:hypothetical protein